MRSREFTKKINEGGPFSYGAKKPRKGSVAANAEQKRREQERGKQPVEPRDQMVGVAKVTKGVAKAERQPGRFSGAWQILVNGKKVHSFRGNFDQETADRVGVVKATSRGLYNPGSGDKIKIVPVMLDQKQGVAEGLKGRSKELDQYSNPVNLAQVMRADRGARAAREQAVKQANIRLRKFVKDFAKEKFNARTIFSQSRPGGRVTAAFILTDSPNYTLDQKLNHDVGKALAQQGYPGPADAPLEYRLTDSGWLSVKVPTTDVKEDRAARLKAAGAQVVAEATEMPMSDYNIDLFQQLVQNYNPKSYAGELVKKELIGPELFPESQTTLELINEIYYENIENGYDGPSLPDEVRDLRFYRMAMKKSLSQGVAEGMEGQVVFSGSGADGGKYEIIQTGPTDFMIHANGKHIDTYSSLQRAMSVLKNEVPGLNKGVAEGSRQHPGDQVRGHESAKASGKQHPFKGRLVGEQQVEEGKKDACYHKVKSRVKVWPSAYASGQLVQCRKRGASNWGTGGKKK